MKIGSRRSKRPATEFLGATESGQNGYDNSKQRDQGKKALELEARATWNLSMLLIFVMVRARYPGFRLCGLETADCGSQVGPRCGGGGVT